MIKLFFKSLWHIVFVDTYMYYRIYRIKRAIRQLERELKGA